MQFKHTHTPSLNSPSLPQSKIAPSPSSSSACDSSCAWTPDIVFRVLPIREEKADADPCAAAALCETVTPAREPAQARRPEGGAD